MPWEELFAKFVICPPIFLPVHNRFYPSKWRVDGSLHKYVSQPQSSVGLNSGQEEICHVWFSCRSSLFGTLSCLYAVLLVVAGLVLSVAEVSKPQPVLLLDVFEVLCRGCQRWHMSVHADTHGCTHTAITHHTFVTLVIYMHAHMHGYTHAHTHTNTHTHTHTE